MRTCTRGNVYVTSARASAEDGFVSPSLAGRGRLAPPLSCCLNGFLTVCGAMYPAVPLRHTSTPPWPQHGKGQRRAWGQDPSDNAAKGCKVRQQAESLS